MWQFRPYLERLETLVATLNVPLPNNFAEQSADELLKEHANRALQKLVPLNELRTQGAFFSSAELAGRVAKLIAKSLTEGARILDPMCGSGDLLLACTPYLQAADSTEAAFSNWSRRLIGRDLHTEFILAARKRLTLALLRRCGSTANVSPATIEGAFGDIRTTDGSIDIAALKSIRHIVFNPPFTSVVAPKSCSWAQGKVNAAALAFEAYVNQASRGTQIVAILPDVLRSGSRYAKWRGMVEAKCRFLNAEVYGQFDSLTDVDVFLLEVVVGSGTSPASVNWAQAASTSDTLGTRVKVNVGAVVSYRDPKKGPLHPFVQSRSLPSWTEIREVSAHRRFAGRVFHPPFVAVRRTSRPGDRQRATATIVATKNAVAVENHLLVLTPHQQTLEQCRKVMRVLQGQRTTDWLNDRIRCRHLTTSAVRDIPWWET